MWSQGDQCVSRWVRLECWVQCCKVQQLNQTNRPKPTKLEHDTGEWRQQNEEHEQGAPARSYALWQTGQVLPVALIFSAPTGTCKTHKGKHTHTHRQQALLETGGRHTSLLYFDTQAVLCSSRAKTALCLCITAVELYGHAVECCSK